MKLLKEKSNYIIESIDEIKTNEEIADILSYFLDGSSLLIFSCIDRDYFLKNLHKEDKKTRDFYNQIIEFNRTNYGEGISRVDKEAQENEKFIKERTVFVNNESEIIFQELNVNKRQTIWYKTLNKNEIIKALNIDGLFKCIVLKEGRDFYEYEYAISQYETDEGNDLIIVEKEKGNFEKYVYPKICEKYMFV